MYHSRNRIRWADYEYSYIEYVVFGHIGSHMAAYTYVCVGFIFIFIILCSRSSISFTAVCALAK